MPLLFLVYQGGFKFMPRVTKDAEKDDAKKKKTVAKETTPVTKKTTKVTKSASKNTAKKETNKKDDKSEKVSKLATKKVANTSKTKNTKASATTKKKTSTPKKKATTPKKKAADSTKKRTTTKSKKLESNVVAEYYDLPYRYNETIVKILYQTPTILFVYWDISDSDREKFIKEYGDNFFYNTKPILKVFNLTKNYQFEIEINDFANSWYIQVNDANCDYKVELARKTIHYEEKLNTDYIYVSSSNDIEFPNDHILLNELPSKINFKNVKTNQVTVKDIRTLHLIGINKVYNVHHFYKTFYKDEILEEMNANKIIIPSSSSW